MQENDTNSTNVVLDALENVKNNVKNKDQQLLVENESPSAMNVLVLPLLLTLFHF